MQLFNLNFDADLLAQVRERLQPGSAQWRELSLSQQLAKLEPYVQAQRARDAQRERVAA